MTIGVLVPWNVLQQIMLYNTQNSVATIIVELFSMLWLKFSVEHQQCKSNFLWLFSSWMLYSFCLRGIKENDPHECYRIGYLEGNGKREGE